MELFSSKFSLEFFRRIWLKFSSKFFLSKFSSKFSAMVFLSKLFRVFCVEVFRRSFRRSFFVEVFFVEVFSVEFFRRSFMSWIFFRRSFFEFSASKFFRRSFLSRLECRSFFESMSKFIMYNRDVCLYRDSTYRDKSSTQIAIVHIAFGQMSRLYAIIAIVRDTAILYNRDIVYNRDKIAIVRVQSGQSLFYRDCTRTIAIIAVGSCPPVYISNFSH